MWGILINLFTALHFFRDAVSMRNQPSGMNLVLSFHNTKIREITQIKRLKCLPVFPDFMLELQKPEQAFKTLKCSSCHPPAKNCFMTSQCTKNKIYILFHALQDPAWSVWYLSYQPLFTIPIIYYHSDTSILLPWILQAFSYL